MLYLTSTYMCKTATCYSTPFSVPIRSIYLRHICPVTPCRCSRTPAPLCRFRYTEP